MEIAEIVLRVPKSWHIALAAMAESADYPSLNALFLQTLEMEFDLPVEPWMGDRIESWWELL